MINCPNCDHGFKKRNLEIYVGGKITCDTCGSILRINSGVSEDDIVLDPLEIKNYHINPVQWTPDGYPVFTDPAQFQRWEEQYRQKLIEEMGEIIDDEVVKRAALAVESRETFIVEEIKRLAAQIERVETDTLDVLGKFKTLYDDHLKKLHFG